MAKEIPIAEVNKHKKRGSAWVIIHNDVYDVTSFLAEHPGGEDTLLDVAGQDGTVAFEDVGHSSDARQLLMKFKIGTLPASEHSKPVGSCCPALDKGKKSKKGKRKNDCGSTSSYRPSKSPYKQPTAPKVERRVQAIVVPRESSKLKWAILALAGAIVIGLALRKYMGNT